MTPTQLISPKILINILNQKKRTKARIIRCVWFNNEAYPEKHYRESILLFTPWRNEEGDLVRNYSSYEEHYLTLQDSVKDQMSLHAVCNEELNSAQEQLNSAFDNDEDQFDLIAPVTQDAEHQDEDEGAINLHLTSMKTMICHTTLAFLLHHQIMNHLF